LGENVIEGENTGEWEQQQERREDDEKTLLHLEFLKEIETRLLFTFHLGRWGEGRTTF